VKNTNAPGMYMRRLDWSNKDGNTAFGALAFRYPSLVFRDDLTRE
jgi:hypothetical protein